MAKEDYIIKPIYAGGYSSLSPEYGSFTGYKMPTSGIGMSTDARTANVLKEISDNLNVGAKSVELTQVSKDVFEAIPKQQFKELNRLSKLTGTEISLHAPVVEPSGFTQQGFSESQRQFTERQMIDAVKKGHEINPNGNIPITFHSTEGYPGDIKQPKEKEAKEFWITNFEGTALEKLPIKEKNYPGEEKQSAKTIIESHNKKKWSEDLKNIYYYAHLGREAATNYDLIANKTKQHEIPKEEMEQVEKRAVAEVNRGLFYLDQAYDGLKSLYEVAYKTVPDADKKILDELKREIEEKANRIKENPESYESLRLREQIIETSVETFNKIHPNIYLPFQDFIKEKSAETFANVAVSSVKEFKDKSPIISIENPPAGTAFSTGEDLKILVERSREKFVEKAIKSKDQGGLGMSSGEAKRQAEKVLGVTWDVGHINMLRKYGYEDKELIEQTEKVAPLVKHVHLSDNFGFEHTELPMGMGNVPIKEMMERLGKEGFKGKKVVEAISWWQHFSPGGKQNPPLKATFEAFGSPMYSSGMGPYWNQAAGLQQDYSSGYGMMLPQTHFETFGAGFSQLPSELGGQKMGGKGSRVSGNPME